MSNFGDQSLIITDDPSVGIKNIFVLALLDSAESVDCLRKTLSDLSNVFSHLEQNRSAPLREWI